MPRPDRDGVTRGTDAGRHPLDGDGALVRGVQPGQDVHEGALAGAVLAQQGMHLAPPELEVDVVVGDEPREALDDAPHLDRERGLTVGQGTGTSWFGHGLTSAGCHLRHGAGTTKLPGGTWPPGSDVNAC